MQKKSVNIFTYFISSIIFLAVVLFPNAMLAQDSLTVDKQFEKARETAFEEENYEKARKIAYNALERSPDYHGIRIFIARLFAWEQHYPKARNELHYVLRNDTDNRQALLAIIDVESWSGNYEKALTWSEKALSHYAQDLDFMLAKAAALENMGEYQRAEETYRTVLEIHSSHKAIQRLESVRLQQMKYSVTVSYRHDRFREIFNPWNFWELQLNRQTEFGSIIGRVQYAKRFATNGVQFNVDAYPSFFKGLYGYISGGYSQSSIYPRYRFGMSLYKSLPAAFELEAGLRYLDFSTSQTTIYTASLSKYSGNYLFTIRTYLVPSTAGNSQSASLLIRRYMADARTYIGLTGGFGSASADIQIAEDIRRLDSWSAGLEGQFPLGNQLNVGGNIGFDSEEFPNFKRDRISAKIFLSYRF